MNKKSLRQNLTQNSNLTYRQWLSGHHQSKLTTKCRLLSNFQQNLNLIIWLVATQHSLLTYNSNQSTMSSPAADGIWA